MSKYVEPCAPKIYVCWFQMFKSFLNFTTVNPDALVLKNVHVYDATKAMIWSSREGHWDWINLGIFDSRQCLVYLAFILSCLYENEALISNIMGFCFRPPTEEAGTTLKPIPRHQSNSDDF